MLFMRRHRPFHAVLFAAMFLLHLASVWSSDFQHGVLWAISKPGIPVSYLLGTIHSDDPRVMRLPSVVEQAFAKSHSFTAELDMHDDSLVQTQQAMLLPQGITLESIISPARFAQCVRLMAGYDIPAAVVNRMKPWAVAVQLNMPRNAAGEFLDRSLYQQAVMRGLPVYALETIPEQIAVFDQMPQAQQIQLLDEAIANYQDTSALINSLIDLYLARDLAGMQAINAEQMQKGDSGLAEKVDQRLILTRNHRMAKRMQVRLDEGNAFIAVGALHLPGKEGILNLLQRQGYLVKPIY